MLLQKQDLESSSVNSYKRFPEDLQVRTRPAGGSIRVRILIVKECTRQIGAEKDAL